MAKVIFYRTERVSYMTGHGSTMTPVCVSIHCKKEAVLQRQIVGYVIEKKLDGELEPGETRKHVHLAAKHGAKTSHTNLDEDQDQYQDQDQDQNQDDDQDQDQDQDEDQDDLCEDPITNKVQGSPGITLACGPTVESRYAEDLWVKRTNREGMWVRRHNSEEDYLGRRTNSEILLGR